MRQRLVHSLGLNLMSRNIRLLIFLKFLHISNTVHHLLLVVMHPTTLDLLRIVRILRHRLLLAVMDLCLTIQDTLLHIVHIHRHPLLVVMDLHITQDPLLPTRTLRLHIITLTNLSTTTLVCSCQTLAIHHHSTHNMGLHFLSPPCRPHGRLLALECIWAQ
jgi:hypothetical protein